MIAGEEVVVPVSRTKIFLSALGTGAFVVAGFWLFFDPKKFLPHDVLWTRFVGVSTIAFFGPVFVYLLKRFFDDRPGLVFGPAGLTDNSSGIAAGLIPWDQITNYSIKEVRFVRFLTIYVRAPEPYLNNGNFLKRLAVKANHRLFGSPIHISSRLLKTSFDQLVTVFQEMFDEYGGP